MSIQIRRRRRTRLSIALAATAVGYLAAFQGNALGQVVGRAPLAPYAHIGWLADRTNGGTVCSVASRDECQKPSKTQSEGGFDYPHDVAADLKTDHIYVAEAENHRVQEMTATGAFLATLGWGVNETEDHRATATQAERNVCTAASRDICAGGKAGAGTEQLDSPASVSVDPDTGDIYVLDAQAGDFRVDKYTRRGRFVWRVGRGVNRDTGGNICTARDAKKGPDRCGAGAQSGVEGAEHGAFSFVAQSGNLLAVDDRRRLLYVGDEHRVQVFGLDGHWKREIPLTSISAAPASNVVALALSVAGALYLVYRVGEGEGAPARGVDTVYKFDPRGDLTGEIRVTGKSLSASVAIEGLAIDDRAGVAVMGIEASPAFAAHFGSLYDGASGALLARLSPPVDSYGIAFGGGDRLYVATSLDQEVAVYAPDPIAAFGGGGLGCGGEGEAEAWWAPSCLFD